MRPPIRKTLTYGIHVELWAWDSGLSRDYRAMAAQESLMEIRTLDSIRDQVTFTEFKSTRRNGTIDVRGAMVLCNFVDGEAYSREQWENYICEEKLMLFHRLFYVSWSRSSNDLVVEFANVSPAELDNLILKTRTLFAGELSVISYPEYKSSTRQIQVDEPHTQNVYGPLDGNANLREVLEEENPAQTLVHQPLPSVAITKHASRMASDGHEDGVPEDDGFQIAGKDPRSAHRRAIKKSQFCKWGIHCAKRGECGSNHTDEEKQLFNTYQDTNFTLWKTKKCENTWPHVSKKCRFAHGKQDAWCSSCFTYGHFNESCRYSSAARDHSW
jgi:hypothetical protein